MEQKKKKKKRITMGSFGNGILASICTVLGEKKSRWTK